MKRIAGQTLYLRGHTELQAQHHHRSFHSEHTHIHTANRQTDKFVLSARVYGHPMYEGQTTRTLLNTRQSKFNENTFPRISHGEFRVSSAKIYVQKENCYPNWKSIHPSTLVQIRMASSDDFYPISPGKLKSEDLSK